MQDDLISRKALLEKKREMDLCWAVTEWDILDAPAAVPEQRWIPVTERMPQQFVSVLACIPCEHPLPMVKEAYFANGCWATRMAIFSDKDVSHWMSLPEPPKEIKQC